MASGISRKSAIFAGLRFAPISTGVRSFDRLVVRFGHTARTSLSDTFDVNLPLGTGTTVLDLNDHVWHHVGDTFNDVGMQVPFAYNGIDNLIVEIITAGAEFEPATPGQRVAPFRQGALPRLVVLGHDGSQATGLLDNGGLKMQFYFADASTGRFGEGCPGSSSIPPELAFTNDPVIGQTFAVDLDDGPAASAAVLSLGINNRQPIFPIDLQLLGAPGCLLHHDTLLTLSAPMNGAGTATLPLALAASQSPATFYCQWLVLDAGANALGVTTSNYGRIAIGF